MCIVFVQAELYQLAPQLIRAVITNVVQSTVDKLIQKLSEIRISGRTGATQIVVDLTGLEDALKCFLQPETKKAFSSIRARLMEKLNEEKFRNSMYTFHTTMALSIQSLDVGEEEGFDSLDSSKV